MPGRGPRYFLGLAVLLSGCAGQRAPAPPAVNPPQARELIERSLPAAVQDRTGWTADVYAGFAALDIAPTRENICAVVAVIDQESGFRVDPVVPGLPAIAWREIDGRAARAGVPRVLLHGVLQLHSSTGRSYQERIDSARTEKDLSDIFDDFIGTVPLGRTLFADRNPIRTRGPMQVQVVFAEQFAAAKPYPYPVKTRIADEVFTRRGGVYFGIAHLLGYQAPYDRYLYRFADFNAGQYASRNAAFQRAVSKASGRPLKADGALLPHDDEGTGAGSTELAVRALSAQLNLSDSAIHGALERAKTRELESTPLYQRVFALADRERTLPRAIIPHIDLHGPKITRKLTTEWYANRVNQRFERCLNR
ncbi:MAG: lipoprotein [Gammaproteobacteria bacterium]|nr:lipoprotein [Gammaproteobacteria bacterium]